MCPILWVPAEPVCHSIAGRGLTSNSYFAQGHCMILRVTACSFKCIIRHTLPSSHQFLWRLRNREGVTMVFLELQKEEKGKVGIRFFVKEKSQHHRSWPKSKFGDWKKIGETAKVGKGQGDEEATGEDTSLCEHRRNRTKKKDFSAGSAGMGACPIFVIFFGSHPLWEFSCAVCPANVYSIFSQCQNRVIPKAPNP